MNIELIMNSKLAPPISFSIIRNRAKTLKGFTDDDTQALRLAQSGLYYDVVEQRYRCHYCSFTIIATAPLNGQKLKYHMYSECARSVYLLRQSELLRHKSFISFENIKNELFVKSKTTIETLAKNGFYYCYQKHVIKCCFCFLTIVKLDENEIINTIHDRYSPDCILFQPQPSAPPIESIQNDSDDAHKGKNIYPRLQDDVIENNNMTNKILNTDVKNNNDNDSDEDNGLCKICFEEKSRVCFLPCRHMCTCLACAKKCKICCLCRGRIRQRFEVFL